MPTHTSRPDPRHGVGQQDLALLGVSRQAGVVDSVSVQLSKSSTASVHRTSVSKAPTLKELIPPLAQHTLPVWSRSVTNIRSFPNNYVNLVWIMSGFSCQSSMLTHIYK